MTHQDSFMSHIDMSLILCVTWMSHLTCAKCLRVTCHVCDKSMCDMTHSRVRHDSWLCVTWLIYVCDVTHAEHRQFWEDRRLYHSHLREKCLCVTRLPHVCDMTHVYMWHDSFTCATWLMSICDMTHLRVRRDSCRTPAILRRSSALPLSSAPPSAPIDAASRYSAYKSSAWRVYYSLSSWHVYDALRGWYIHDSVYNFSIDSLSSWYVHDSLSSWHEYDALRGWYIHDSLSLPYVNDSLSSWYVQVSLSSWPVQD